MPRAQAFPPHLMNEKCSRHNPPAVGARYPNPRVSSQANNQAHSQEAGPSFPRITHRRDRLSHFNDQDRDPGVVPYVRTYGTWIHHPPLAHPPFPFCPCARAHLTGKQFAGFRSLYSRAIRGSFHLLINEVVFSSWYALRFGMVMMYMNGR